MLLFEKGPGRSRPLRLLAVVLLAITLATGSPALAQTPQEPPSSAPSEKGSADRGPTDQRELEAFLDGYLGHQLEDYDIPGATVSVVKDGEILFAKGYGRANVAKKEPVVADETLFRIASVSKLFTATAAMQLVEEGRLDLDEDVNVYLDDVEVPNTYPGRPVTLRHLLTHTAGFEEAFTGSGARDAADVEPLGEFLDGQMPARVRPPGEVTAYSNYGMALVGYMVQEVSGVPFERYVEENITNPLGMESTTAAQPPAPELRERLARGYDLEGGDPVARPYEYFDDAPAGSVCTTATDIGRFMFAHLQDGRYGDTRIMEEETAREMHERQFALHPRLDGMAYGFYEQTINGERTIQHGGNLYQFHANLVLLPEHDVGIFVAYNSYGEGGDYAEYELVEAFLDRYYPGPPIVEPSDEGASGNVERLAGSYRAARSNQTGFEKVITLLSGTRVTANEDGSITTTGGFLSRNLDDTEQHWGEVKPLLFRAEDRNEYIAFREDGEGRALYLSGDADPTVGYEKVSPYEAPRFHLGLLAGSLGILLLTAVAWPVGALIARRYRRRYGKASGEPGQDAGRGRLARLLAWAVCALDLLFVIAVILLASNLEETLAYGATPSLIAVLTLPLVSAVLTAGVLVYAILVWKRGYWGLIARMHYSLVALSALTFTALLGYYNLLGFQF
jgi:CubicO group peptidase (beta-lactamase class C family)